MTLTEKLAALRESADVIGLDSEEAVANTEREQQQCDRLAAYIGELEQGLEGYRMSDQRPDRDTYDASAAFAALDALLREAERSHGDLVNDEHPVLKRLQVARQIDLLTAERDHWRKVAEKVGWVWLSDFYTAQTIDDDGEWATEMVSIRLDAAKEAVGYKRTDSGTGVSEAVRDAEND